ncbi:HNH endonuclease [Clostridium butyricum]
MYKINVTKKLKKSHKRYFVQNIIPDIKRNDIKFYDDDIKQITENNNTYFLIKYDIQRIHDEFLEYCINNQERISIGNYNELRQIEHEIEGKFPFIIALISDKKFKFSAAHNKYRGKMYWEALVDIFGYNNFGNCDLFDVIRDIAKNSKGIKDLNNPSNKLIVQEEIVKITKRLFPQIVDVIERKFNNVLNINNIINIDKFKEKFIDLEKRYSLTLTLENYKNIESYGVWNSYLFVYASDIRTCPYCNRQYITPVLTSSGKMRATLDHFLPKNRYPYFSMSLYNLVPACYNCNSSLKGRKDFDINDINPYSESIDDYIKFEADMRLNYRIRLNIMHKKICKYKEVDKYISMFKLKEQYNYHTNQVEELLLKRYMYSDKYIKDIKEKILNKFNISEKDIKEKIIGYTEDKTKINDEPLSKFRRDIVEQLGFFDDYDLYLENKLEEILQK